MDLDPPSSKMNGSGCTQEENELLVLGMLQGLSLVYLLVQHSPAPWQIWLCWQRQAPGIQCGCFWTHLSHSLAA